MSPAQQFDGRQECLPHRFVLFAEEVRTRAANDESPATQPAAVAADPAFHIDAKQTLEYLSSDELEGRGVGTEGLDKAAERIAEDFHRLGLQPLPGQTDYFQRFKITTSVAPDPRTALSLGGTDYALGKDFAPLPFSAEAAFKGDVVFVGYGISSKKYDYDDYAGIDAKGKIVLALRFEPHNEKGTSRFVKENYSEEAPLARKAAVAAEHGAAALILVNPRAFHPGDVFVPFNRGAGADKSSIPFIQVHQDVVDAWLKNSGSPDLRALQASIDKDGKPASAALAGLELKGEVVIKRVEKEVKNVIGVVPGNKADEYLVIGAHYDHLGFGGPGSLAPGVHAIHHGADDNASGTTAVLKLADHFAHAPRGDKTLVFMTFTGEEEGLLGSAYFVAHPLIPLNHIVAMLNLDMVGRVRDQVLYVGGEGTAPSFDAMLKEAKVDSPLELKSIGRGGLGPSDHMSFALKKIPVLFFFTGMHIDYHRPTDTADKVNFTGIDEVVAFSAKLIDGLEDMNQEKYVDAADKDSMMGFGHAGSGGGGGGSGVSLGVIPNYSELDTGAKGVKIDGTMPGSGAQKAGLQAGDIIVRWNATKLESLQQLQNLLDGSKPGDKIKLGILRDGKETELEATLTERK